MLARIEPSSFETRVREQEAGVAIAKANIDLQEAGVVRADANLHKAELDLSRAQQLVVKGATSQSAVDAALPPSSAPRPTSPSPRRKSTTPRRHLPSTRPPSTAPASISTGPISARPSTASSSTRSWRRDRPWPRASQAPKLFTIAEDLSHVQIEAQVDEADIGQVIEQQSGHLHASMPIRTRSSRAKSSRSGWRRHRLQNVVTYTVVIGADNPLGRLLPGMTANVEIVTGEHQDVVMVPNEALRFQPRGPAEALVRDTGATGASPVASAGDDRTARLLDTAEGRSRP